MKKRAKILAMFFVAFVMVSTATGKIIFVDADATAANDGSSWADAYNDLQDTLTVAQAGDEIHVAQGIYKPDQGAGITAGDREATFQLINGVTIKGGYAGFGEPDPDSRDIDAHETILSGDLAGNDVDVNDPADLLGEQTRAENSYHVVTTSDTNETAVLDGFTITGGNANRKEAFNYQDCGGGVYNYKGSPTIKNCKIGFNSARKYGGGMYNDGREGEGSPAIMNCQFVANSASSGSGIYNYKSNPRIDNCRFAFNWASGSGGGISNGISNGRLTNCTFIGNKATLGGGMVNGDSSPVLNHCTFNENSSAYGGAMFNAVCSPTLTNCTFRGNSAVSQGGGMANASSSPILTNCTFSNNSAEKGGGMFNYMDRGPGGFDQSNPTLTNCIFSMNFASEDGGGMCNTDESNPTLNNCTFAVNSALNGSALACDSYQQSSPSNLQLTNCILWDGGNEIWNNDASAITIRYSDVQDGWPGEGNIDADPLFRDADGLDNITGTEDDNLRLLPGSPCIDAGDPNYVPEPNETDLDGRPRVINGRIDMGAYEYSSPIPAEVRIVPRTINLTSKGNWITAYIWLPEDYDVGDIDSSSIFLNRKIQAESVQIDEEKQVVVARFYRPEAQGILYIGEVELTISVLLTNGTVFEGRDVIQVVNKEGGGKPAKYGKASNPNPADGATGVDINADLSWTADRHATSHDVYFGTSSPPPFVCNQTSTTFDPGTMACYPTYYWRIDEVNKWGTATGEVWKFTTLPLPPPTPP